MSGDPPKPQIDAWDLKIHFDCRFRLGFYTLPAGKILIKNLTGEIGRMFRWAIKHQLARGRRPGVELKRGSQVPKSVVDAWIGEAKDAWGVRSVICILDECQLRYYETLATSLPSYCRSKGLRVVHISAANMQHPPLSDKHQKAVWKAYTRLPKPVLVHCSAGIGRTGAAARYIKQQIAARALSPDRVNEDPTHGLSARD